MTAADLYGSIGVSLILLAYFLNLFDKLQPEQAVYRWMNLIGAALAFYSSYLLRSMPFMILEATWAFVSLYALVVKGKKP
jgi:hypothetical protein